MPFNDQHKFRCNWNLSDANIDFNDARSRRNWDITRYESWSRDSLGAKYPDAIRLFKFYEPGRCTGSLIVQLPRFSLPTAYYTLPRYLPMYLSVQPKRSTSSGIKRALNRVSSTNGIGFLSLFFPSLSLVADGNRVLDQRESPK